MIRKVTALVVATGSLVTVTLLPARDASSQVPGDSPILRRHVNQADLDSGRMRLSEVVEAGRFLFSARFNVLDGFGRPGATGNGVPTRRETGASPFMNRVSGLDANSCAGCHNQPEVGGAGDFVANVFVLGQLADPVLTSIDSEFSNERNTLGMHGAGAIEMLAVEMSRDLIAIREAARRDALRQRRNVVRALVTKGVTFGSITSRADGTVDTSGVEGVDADLVIKPFHQKGVVNSLREFTNNAFNHHHGMQSVERFGFARTGVHDFDEDGVRDELSVGDISVATLYQAALSIPGQVRPQDPRERFKIEVGAELFERVGCANCHRPTLVLDDRNFHEPNPFNQPGNLRPSDVPRAYSFDMTREGIGNRLERLPNGKAVVRAFTDLKRHVIADAEDPFFANERRIQGGVPLDVFLTRKLWDCGNTAPYGHRGDCSTIGEAIQHHAGEARASRNAFMALGASDQASIIAFLGSLQILPEDRGR